MAEHRQHAEMREHLYTVICEFRGGTYCSQVEASDEVDAVRLWAEKLQLDMPMARSSRFLAKAALRDLETFDHKPVPLDGLQGVWCFSTGVATDLALCNLVLTSARVGHPAVVERT